MFRRTFAPELNHSFFLLGPRGTGKSSLIEHSLLPRLARQLKNKSIWTIDLLDPEQEEKFKASPGLLKEVIRGEKYPWVIIDEIQKVPELLDVAHYCIEKFKTKFILTGSSARKLKREGANLLAGRAFEFNLHPLTFLELEDEFNLEKIINWGSLPSIFSLNDANKARYLRTYVNTYLKEEILQEQIIRKIDGFRSFLQVAAQHNGKIINYSNIARDSGVDPKTVASYFEVLKDTLIGFQLEPFHESIRKQQSKSPKFYFFDLGVVRALLHQLDVPVVESSYHFGNLFEQYIILESIRFNHYLEKDFQFSYFRDSRDLEIDLLIKRPGKRGLAVEIKSSTKITDEHCRNLLLIKKDLKNFDPIILCREKKIRILDNGIKIYPWQKGLSDIFSGKI